jgi:hypothetical protein
MVSRQFIIGVWIALVSICSIEAQVIINNPDFHPRYQKVATFRGEIMDVTPEAILYSDWDFGERRLKRFDMATRSTTVLRTNEGWGERIIPNGVLLNANNGGGAIIQLEDGEEIDTGLMANSGIVFPDRGERTLEGRFGLLDTTIGLVLRDFVARTNFLFPTNLVYWSPLDVAVNGNAVLTTMETNSTYEVLWYQDGELQTLMESKSRPYVRTDGTNVLWTASEIPNEPYTEFIYLRTPSETIPLETNTYLLPEGFIPISPLPPPSDVFAINNGWVAFPRFSPASPFLPYDIWRRSPDGTLTQCSVAPSLIKAMRSDGALLIQGFDLTGTKFGLIFVPPFGPAKLISNDFESDTRYFVSGSQFYALAESYSGMALYRVDVEGAPFGLTLPAFDSATGMLSYNIYPSESGSFALQRSTDFANWTTIATNSVTEAKPTRFEVSAEPGFFRLQQI